MSTDQMLFLKALFISQGNGNDMSDMSDMMVAGHAIKPKDEGGDYRKVNNPCCMSTD